MNKERRKKIAGIVNELDVICSELEFLAEEEQGALDSMPEGLQCSERGEYMEECIEVLVDAYETIYDFIQRLCDL